MKDKNNFFVFVSQWESVIIQMDTHIRAFYMQSAFNIYRENVTNPTDDMMLAYRVQLGTFIVESQRWGGTADEYTIPERLAVAAVSS